VPSRLRVPCGYLVGFVVLFLARPTAASLLLALPPVLAGEALRLWASGHLEKTRSLATGGPYAHTRNPLYLGSLLIALGVTVASASPWAVLAMAAYFAAFYPRVMREEAAFLGQRFPADYASWARAVPAFLPRLRPAGPRATRFTAARVAENREWRTAAAIPLFTLLLYLRGWLS
jgi:protein-S-isoprenylcysteine O-methyltransferase Ste14